MKKKMNKKSVTVKKAALATMCLACVLSVLFPPYFVGIS